VNLEALRAACFAFLAERPSADVAHDVSHVQRVLKNTLYLSDIEGADTEITLPAACLHDCVAVPKDSPLRARGSRLAADAAADFLRSVDYPAKRIPAVRHAIAAHSYTAGIPVLTVEAAVVQDADRLDSLGAIGIARCLLVGGRLDRPLLARQDPFCDERPPDDGQYTIDHFYSKLFRLPETMQTAAGREEAQRRAALMRRYLDDLRAEVL
jgi:uncharacterized protein